MAEDARLVAIDLDETSIARRGPDVEHERRVAIFDLIEQNSFRPRGEHPGPFRLNLGIAEGRLVLDVPDTFDQPVLKVILALSPLRNIIKEYQMVCDSYYEAIKTASPQRIEAIDMGRRGLHDQGSDVLRERLAGKIEVDFDTARRLFTLICALLMKA